MSLSPLQKVQLAKAVGAARASRASTGCPVELSVSQWALESWWGARQPGNNCFGIKVFPGCYGVQTIDTWEVEAGKKVKKSLPFAMFKFVDDCFQKHGELITKAPAYRKYFAEFSESGDVAKLVNQVGKVYATDPAYASKLLEILSMPDVKDALKPATIQSQVSSSVAVSKEPAD